MPAWTLGWMVDGRWWLTKKHLGTYAALQVNKGVWTGVECVISKTRPSTRVDLPLGIRDFSARYL